MIPGSDTDHVGFKRTFGFAIQGFRMALRTERNIRVMLGAAAFIVALGLIVQLDLMSWAVILLCCGAVLMAELMNTAIETIVDLVSPEYHHMAGRAKDIAAAAVWTLSVFVAVVGIIVFVRAIMMRFS
ncbi:MAG: diacylglycerol kinase family protein [Atopobiaceae bacterium]|nr:diacylglycerol kinase family protein [Atopobiaceae bacterium]